MINPFMCSVVPEMTNIGTENEASMYMLVKDRLEWFLAWARENHTDVSIKEGTDASDVVFCGKQVLVKCRIFIDGKEAAVGIGSVDFELCPSPLANAATIAKGRALANLGFGISKEGDANGELEMLPDAPIKRKEVTQKTSVQGSEETPESVMPKKRRTRQSTDTKQEKTEPDEEAVIASPTPNVSVPVAPAKQKLSQKEAMAFIVPVPGPFCGKSLGEVNATAPWAVETWAEVNRPFGSRDVYPDFVEAAKVVVACRG